MARYESLHIKIVSGGDMCVLQIPMRRGDSLSPHLKYDEYKRPLLTPAGKFLVADCILTGLMRNEVKITPEMKIFLQLPYGWSEALDQAKLEEWRAIKEDPQVAQSQALGQTRQQPTTLKTKFNWGSFGQRLLSRLGLGSGSRNAQMDPATRRPSSEASPS